MGLIIFVAGYFDRYPKRAYSFWQGVIPVVMLAAVYAGMIMLQPNMSTAFTIVFIAGRNAAGLRSQMETYGHTGRWRRSSGSRNDF